MQEGSKESLRGRCVAVLHTFSNQARSHSAAHHRLGREDRIRITVGTAEENDMLLEALKAVL